MADARRPARNRRDAAGLWDRPQLLNLIADFLLVSGAAGLGYCAVVMVLSLPIFPLREVVVVNTISHTTEEQVQYAARSSLAGNFFTVNLDRVRASFEKLPWVRHAEVRRQWPATLAITLEEHVPVAYWRRADEGEVRLVNNAGEVFNAAADVKLPDLQGPEGSAGLLLARFQEFSDQLRPMSRTLTKLTLSDRQAWQMRLDNGMVINLGREQTRRSLNERLARFVAVSAPALEAAGAKAGIKPMVADLRYPNGFVLKSAAAEKGKS